MPAARPVPGHPVGLRARWHGAGPAEPHPPGLGHPDLPHVAGHAPHVPLPAAAHDPESLIPAGLAPRRPPGRVARVEERRHRPREVAQGLLLDGLGAGGQPRVPGPRGGELPALLQVTGSGRPARGASGRAARRPVSTRTGRGRSGPAAPLAGRGWGGVQPVPGHANTLSDTADISGEVTRRVLPGLKTGVSTPRFW
jgi:hypothetical protein